MYILDTDHLVVLQKRSGPELANLLRRVSQFDRSVFFVTIVSFHEQIGGWYQYLGRATSSAGVVRGYERLETILRDFAVPHRDVKTKTWE
jgi:tRNA(fMet)-specific endonuclease VapC